jgi:hypothetical protein
MESHVVNYSSPRGFNGYYFVNAQWSPVLEIFRLHDVVFKRSQPLAISDGCIWPRGSARQREGPDCRI